MSGALTVHATHQSGMHFTAAARGHTIDIDYPLQEGEAGAGLTSLETLLAALTTCCGNSMVVLLNKMRQPFTGIEVTAHAERREEHPTVLTRIDLDVVVRGEGIDQAAAERALKLGEEQICPVWAMLKPETPIAASVRVEQG
jgi:putative redox protein